MAPAGKRVHCSSVAGNAWIVAPAPVADGCRRTLHGNAHGNACSSHLHQSRFDTLSTEQVDDSLDRVL
jgi:hypothetical protein